MLQQYIQQVDLDPVFLLQALFHSMIISYILQQYLIADIV